MYVRKQNTLSILFEFKFNLVDIKTMCEYVAFIIASQNSTRWPWRSWAPEGRNCTCGSLCCLLLFFDQHNNTKYDIWCHKPQVLTEQSLARSRWAPIWMTSALRSAKKIVILYTIFGGLDMLSVSVLSHSKCFTWQHSSKLSQDINLKIPRKYTEAITKLRWC